MLLEWMHRHWIFGEQNKTKHLKYKKLLAGNGIREMAWMSVLRHTDEIGLFASYCDSPSFPPHIKAEIAICLAVCFE